MPKLLLLPGDGIGPEVIAEVRRIAERIANDIELEERALGGARRKARRSPKRRSRPPRPRTRC